MEFTVQNNSLLYSVSFTEETARISIRDMSIGLYESLVTLIITVWHIIEHQRQQFDTYHQGQVPITENQLGTHAMGHKVAVISGHHYPHVEGTDVPDNYVAGSFQYTFPWKEGQIRNNWFNTPETSQVSSPEQQNNLLYIVNNAGSIKDGKAHSPIVLTDEAPVTPISVRPTMPPAIYGRVRPFGNETCQITL